MKKLVAALVMSILLVTGAFPATVQIAQGKVTTLLEFSTMVGVPRPYTGGGNASIEAHANLPHPCIAPIVFVASPGGAWFAATDN